MSRITVLHRRRSRAGVPVALGLDLAPVVALEFCRFPYALLLPAHARAPWA